MNHIRSVLFSALILAVALQGCRKNTPVSWDTNITAPLVYSTIGLEDLLPDSTLFVNGDSSLMIAYSDTLYSMKVEDVFEFPDTTINESFSIPLPSLTVNPGDQFVNDVTDVEYGGIDATLSEVIVKEGYIDYQLSSPITEETIYTYSIPSATLSGVPFQKVITVPPGSQSNPTVVAGSFDISGYHLDLTGSSGTEVNTIQTQVTVETSPTSSPVTVTNSDVVTVSNTFRDIVPYFARGYFGQRVISDSDPGLPFDGMAGITSGTIDIDSLDVTLTIRNGIGVDGRLTINNLTSVNGASAVPLAHNIIGSTININRAINTGSTFTTNDYVVQLDETNSNIDLFVENLPSEMGYSVDLEMNPMGNVSNGNDFIYCESSLDILMDAEFPLSFIANDLELLDTFDIRLEQPESGGSVKKGTIHLILDNGFPLDAEASILLFDEFGTIADTLTTSGKLLAGTVDANNVVISPTRSVMSFTANQMQTEMLFESQKIALLLSFSTPPSTQHYKLYDHYRVGVKVTADVTFNVKND